MSKLLIIALTLLVLPIVFFIFLGTLIFFMLSKAGIISRHSFGYKGFGGKGFGDYKSNSQTQKKDSPSQTIFKPLLNCRHQSLEQNEYGMVCLDCKKIIQHNDV